MRAAKGSRSDPRITGMDKVMSRWAGGGSQERLVVFSNDLWPALSTLLNPLSERFGEDRVDTMGVENSDDRYLFIDADVSTAELGDLVARLVDGSGFAVTVEPGLEYMAADDQVRVARR